MRTYTGNRFFLILFNRVLPYHLIEVIRNSCITTIFAAIMSAINIETGLDITITAPWNNTLSVFNFFLCMFISFRLNNSFGNWYNGVKRISSFENIASKLMNNIYSALITDTIQEDRQQRLDFIWEFKNIVILFIANVFQECSHNNGRHDNIREQYLTSQQIADKDAINSLIKKSKDSDKNIIESQLPPRFYIKTLDLELRKMINITNEVFGVHPNTLSSLNAKVDNLSQIHNELYIMSHIPVVFIYNQFINFVITTYLILYTLMTIPDSGYWSTFWVFIWSFIVFLANSISDEIELPFGTDNNDIELEIILLNIKDEYRTMFEYVSKKVIT